ncbi:sodium:solute symporter family transporter [Provencibacterium massiliense]|uniref:sodium:solute symporter family transporter n=1 Tax=Provencibacterium massiliense TaxID=1841868 RepID=UPI0009A808C1|nr:sodium:solute symporter [Provencibacterium massiliense]RGB67264.1 sodium:solute symporter [Harryflintia acetispora]
MLEKVVILILFFALTVGIGVYCRKHAASVGDFVLGGRNVGAWVTAFAYGTSYFSAVVFIGYAGQFGWSFGVSATWIGIGNALIGSLLAWVLLGRRTRIMTKHYESATMPDFFAKRYESSALKVVASVIIFIFLVPYSASVYKGLSGLFSMAFGIDFTWCILGMALLTGIYVIVGGYMAAALNDLVQGIIMLGGIVAVVLAILNTQGGFIAAIEKLSGIPCESAPALSGAYASFFGPDPVGLLGVVILTSLGTWGLPQMVHKFYTIKNEKAIKAGTVISTLFALVIAGGSYFMGAFGRLFYAAPDGKVQYDSIVPTMLAESLPNILIGVVIILVLSASMSTLSSLVIASSSTFTLDFLKGFLLKDLRQSAQVGVIKFLCGFFILLSVLIALNPNSLITTLMSLSWGALAGSFLGPFLYGLFWRGTTRLSVWASFATGIGINVLNLVHPFTAPTTAGAISIVASLIVVPLVSLITPKLPREHVDHAFSCYDEKVAVSHKLALEEVSE